MALLLLQPERRLHVREVARLTGTVAGTMSKELKRLHQVGLLLLDRVGNQVHFQANTQHPVYPELSALLRKTIGLADVLTLALGAVSDRIQAAFVYGSVAQSRENSHSDVDVMIVGNLTFSEAVKALYDAQSQLQREINAKVFSAKEWHDKLAEKSPFVLDVMAKPKLFLIGSEHDLQQS